MDWLVAGDWWLMGELPDSFGAGQRMAVGHCRMNLPVCLRWPVVAEELQCAQPDLMRVKCEEASSSDH